MKKICTLLTTIAFSCALQHSKAQLLNWANLKKEQKHIIHINAGCDYGLTLGAAYNYRLQSKLPAALEVAVVVPAGNKLFDDLKTKIGGIVQAYRINTIFFSVSIHGIYRRYGNTLVRMQNFGSEINGVIGLYNRKWFLAAELGFDKAIVTHFKHTAVFKYNLYADVKDGWYEPATGGNFSFGIQTGHSFSRHDISFKAGKLVAQDLRNTVLIPYYLQLNYSIKMKK